ncbi:hypothetical protein C8J56DRAFT_1066709 [Mycena floridula]|nr:hypothetical protein C8J56DRAFT_1066709 [Mycena floridula]
MTFSLASAERLSETLAPRLRSTTFLGSLTPSFLARNPRPGLSTFLPIPRPRPSASAFGVRQRYYTIFLARSSSTGQLAHRSQKYKVALRKFDFCQWIALLLNPNPPVQLTNKTHVDFGPYFSTIVYTRDHIFHRYRMMVGLHCHSDKRLELLKNGIIPAYEEFCESRGTMGRILISSNSTLPRMLLRISDKREPPQTPPHDLGRNAEHQMSIMDEKQEMITRIRLAIDRSSEAQKRLQEEFMEGGSDENVPEAGESSVAGVVPLHLPV